MHVLSLFIRTCLVWLIIFLAPPFETNATQETKLKSQRYYADGIQLSQAKLVMIKRFGTRTQSPLLFFIC